MSEKITFKTDAFNAEEAQQMITDYMNSDDGKFFKSIMIEDPLRRKAIHRVVFKRTGLWQVNYNRCKVPVNGAEKVYMNGKLCFTRYFLSY